LTLDELVAATLILYPRYMNWETGAFTTPEFAIETLRKQIDALGGKPINKISWLHRQARKMKHFYKGVFAKP
jgi:capsular polysaccharide export protein